MWLLPVGLDEKPYTQSIEEVEPAVVPNSVSPAVGFGAGAACASRSPAAAATARMVAPCTNSRLSTSHSIGCELAGDTKHSHSVWPRLLSLIHMLHYFSTMIQINYGAGDG